MTLCTAEPVGDLCGVVPHGSRGYAPASASHGRLVSWRDHYDGAGTGCNDDRATDCGCTTHFVGQSVDQHHVRTSSLIELGCKIERLAQVTGSRVVRGHYAIGS